MRFKVNFTKRVSKVNIDFKKNIWRDLEVNLTTWLSKSNMCLSLWHGWEFTSIISLVHFSSDQWVWTGGLTSQPHPHFRLTSSDPPSLQQLEIDLFPPCVLILSCLPWNPHPPLDVYVGSGDVAVGAHRHAASWQHSDTSIYALRSFSVNPAHAILRKSFKTRKLKTYDLFMWSCRGKKFKENKSQHLWSCIFNSSRCSMSKKSSQSVFYLLFSYVIISSWNKPFVTTYLSLTCHCQGCRTKRCEKEYVFKIPFFRQNPFNLSKSKKKKSPENMTQAICILSALFFFQIPKSQIIPLSEAIDLTWQSLPCHFPATLCWRYGTEKNGTGVSSHMTTAHRGTGHMGTDPSGEVMNACNWQYFSYTWHVIFKKIWKIRDVKIWQYIWEYCSSNIFHWQHFNNN